MDKLTYKSIAWVGDVKDTFHVVDLTIGDENYGSQIIPLQSAIGQVINKFLTDNDIIIPVAEIGPSERELTDDELFTVIQENIQRRLDEIAQSKNYDDVFSCISYINSGVKTFANEAKALSNYRDTCWNICYEMLNNYTAGKIKRPTLQDVMDKLPKFEW